MAARKDLTGMRFGSLVALEPTEKREDRYTVWKCACDCGKTAYISSKKLSLGTVTSCGCQNMPPRRHGRRGEDLTGRRFGRLVALERAENGPDGKTRWLCRCDCGKLKAVRTCELKSGHVKSCGCLRPHADGLELAGKRFSRLVVEYKTDKRDRKGSVIWHCRCDCGNEIDVPADSLVNGRYVSCGCRRREWMSQIPDTLTFVDGTCVEWLRSRTGRSDNTSGHCGVSMTKRGTWRAMIGFRKKRYYLGTYKTFEEAVRARDEAAEEIHQGFLEAYDAYTGYAKDHPEWAEENPFVFEVERRGGTVCVTEKTAVPKEESRFRGSKTARAADREERAAAEG